MKRIIFSIFTLWILGSGMPREASAAIIYPAAVRPEVHLNQPLLVDVRLNSEGQQVNAVEAVVTFDPNQLLYAGVSTDGSLLTLWTEQPRETKPGRIVFSGGIPDGTLSVDGRLISIFFYPIRSGASTIGIEASSSGVYLHDGLGTPARLATKEMPVQPHAAPEISGAPYSPTHPIESKWYRDPNVVVSWTRSTARGVSFGISRDALTEVDEFAEENTGIVSYPALSDGRWFFGIKERTGDEWSKQWQRVFQVDATPPLPFAVERSAGSQVNESLILFAPSDATSGIDHMVAQIERRYWWKPWVLHVQTRRVTGPFVIAHDQSLRRVSVIAFDRAGNSRVGTWATGRDAGKFYIMSVLLGSGLIAVVWLVWIAIRDSHRRVKKIVKVRRSR